MLTHGLPAAGKSAFARQYAETRRMAYIHCDRIRFELFDDIQFTPSENKTILRLATMIAEEFLKLSQPLVFDLSLPSSAMRREMKQLAQRFGYNFVVAWVQTDYGTALRRAVARDRRRPDDKYSPGLSPKQFELLASRAGQPDIEREAVAVLSGQHAFSYQAKLVDHRLRRLGYLPARLKPKPAGRVDLARRQAPVRANYGPRSR